MITAITALVTTVSLRWSLTIQNANPEVGPKTVHTNQGHGISYLHLIPSITSGSKRSLSSFLVAKERIKLPL